MDEIYTKILNRYLFTDIVLILILVLVTFICISLIFKFFPDEKTTKKCGDWNNRTTRLVMCISISIICILAVVVTSAEILNITYDLENSAYIYCAGSYSTTRNEMVVTMDNGNILKLQYLHSTLSDFESDFADIVYSEKSHILLSCKIK